MSCGHDCLGVLQESRTTLSVQGRQHDVYDVTDAFVFWLAASADRNQRVLLIETADPSAYTALYPSPNDGDNMDILLVVYKGISRASAGLVSEELVVRARRSRRSVRATRGRNDQCGIRQWYVDFRAMGWNSYILQPAGYNANTCVGVCPDGFLQTAHQNVVMTGHGHMKQLYESHGLTGAPALCCVPSSLSAISIMYRGPNGTIAVRRYPEMTAQTCQCL